MTDLGNHRHVGVLVLAAELAGEERIEQLGARLSSRGFRFVAATAVGSSRSFVDLIYDRPLRELAERAVRLPAAYLSYTEFAPSATIVLVEQDRPRMEPAQTELNRIKGSSSPVHLRSDALRAMSPFITHHYSYFHVPDEHILPLILTWAFLPPSRRFRLASPDDWAVLSRIHCRSVGAARPQVPAGSTAGRLLSPGPDGGQASSPTALLGTVVERCLDLALLSRFDGIRDLADGQWRSAVGQAASEPLREGAARLGRELRPHLLQAIHQAPLETFAGRRVALVLRLVVWLLSPQDWSIANVTELTRFAERAGVPLGLLELQLLRAWMLYLSDELPYRQPDAVGPSDRPGSASSAV
jgi:hypothetical protein